MWLHSFKAFALTGRQGCVHNNPGRCPGLGASALSGRVEEILAQILLRFIITKTKFFILKTKLGRKQFSILHDYSRGSIELFGYVSFFKFFCSA